MIANCIKYCNDNMITPQKIALKKFGKNHSTTEYKMVLEIG